MTTLEELGPYAVTFHLRDSVVYEVDGGVAVQWVPLGEGTPDFKAIVARAAEIMPANVHVFCKPITARPPVILPVFTEEFWTRWFPGGRSRDFSDSSPWPNAVVLTTGRSSLKIPTEVATAPRESSRSSSLNTWSVVWNIVGKH